MSDSDITEIVVQALYWKERAIRFQGLFEELERQVYAEADKKVEESDDEDDEETYELKKSELFTLMHNVAEAMRKGETMPMDKMKLRRH